MKIPSTISCRPFSTDWIAIYQTFGQEHFQGLKGLSDIRTIVDLGAYIGTASYYLKSLYPEDKLIALEPQDIPYELCRKNLEDFDDVYVLQRAIWGYNTFLKLQRMRSKTNYFRWHETGTRIRADSKGDIAGITIPTLMKTFGIEKIDILKIDIEGAEKTILHPANADWLFNVKNLCIEIHRGCENIVFHTLRMFDFNYIQHGEVHNFLNLKSKEI